MRKIVLIFILISISAGLLNSLTSEERYRQKQEFKQRVYDQTLQFIKNNQQAPDLARMYFNLAEMSTEIEINEEKNNPSLVASYYKKVIEIDPNFEKKDVCLYNYAYYSYDAIQTRLNEQRQNYILTTKGLDFPASMRFSEQTLKEPIDAYKKLGEMTNSGYYAESLFRLGMIYFNIEFDSPGTKVYKTSIQYFDKLAALPLSEDLQMQTLQNSNIFMRGWVYYNAGDYEAAINDFSSVLERIKASKNERLISVFQENALEKMASTLIEFDGNDYESQSQAAQAAMDILVPELDKEYVKDSILRSIELKKRYRAYWQVIDLYNVYIKADSTDINCPVFIDSIKTMYADYGPNLDTRYPNVDDPIALAQTLIFKEKERLVYNYSVDSAWYQANTSHNIIAQLEIIHDSFIDVEARYYNSFISEKTQENYERYMTLAERFRSFLDKSGISDPDKLAEIEIHEADLSFERADQLKQPQVYLQAINSLEGYLSKYPQSPKQSDYEARLYYCQESMFTLLKPKVQESTYVDSLTGFTMTKQDLYKRYIDATLRYERALEQGLVLDSAQARHQALISVLRNRATVYYESNRPDEAFAAYQALLGYDPDNDTKTLAYERMAEISRKRGNFDQAAGYYDNAMATANAEEKQAYAQNKLATLQAKAENLTQTGSFQTAAAQYLSLAKEYERKDSEQALGYKNQAIEAFKNGGMYNEAIDQYLELAAKATDRELVLGFYVKAWTLADEQNWFDRSISLRREFITRYPKSNDAFKIEQQIIAKYRSNFTPGDKASEDQAKQTTADMLLELHDKVVRNKVDTGDLAPSALYLEAIGIYAGLGMETKAINLGLAFERQYPQHPQANQMLQDAATYYYKTGQQNKVEEIAIYMHKKDPTLNLYETMAKEDIAKFGPQIIAIWDARDYYSLDNTKNELANLRKDYDAMVRQYRSNGLNDVSYQTGYDAFDEYNGIIKKLQSFEKDIERIKESFIDKQPSELIRVVAATTWNANLVGGDKRFEQVILDANEVAQKLTDIVQKAISDDLIGDIPTERLSYVYWMRGKAFEHASQAIGVQFERYLKISREITATMRELGKEEFEQQVLNPIMISGDNGRDAYQLAALNYAKQYYDAFLGEFFLNREYFDQWTNNALTWMQDNQIDLGFEWATFVTDENWDINNQPLAENALATYTDISYWQQVIGLDDKAQESFSNAHLVMFDQSQDVYLRRIFVGKGVMQKLTVWYLANTQLDIWVNGVKLAAATIEEERLIDGQKYNKYQVVASDVAASERYSVIIKVRRNPSMPVQNIAAALRVIYVPQQQVQPVIPVPAPADSTAAADTTATTVQPKPATPDNSGANPTQP